MHTPGGESGCLSLWPPCGGGYRQDEGEMTLWRGGVGGGGGWKLL